MSRQSKEKRLGIAWDFDGVLNANIRDGRFIWSDGFERFTGQSLAVFKEYVFGDNFIPVITGREDVRARVATWARQMGYAPGPDAILDYWFSTDFFPDKQVLSLVDTLCAEGVQNVLATNNERRRVARIAEHKEFGSRMQRIFASGELGVCKPNAEFFDAIGQQLGQEAARLVLVDDSAANVRAAQDCGWNAFHFTSKSRVDLAAWLNGIREGAV